MASRAVQSRIPEVEVERPPMSRDQTRMIDDPHLSLTDVQWVLGHAHLTTTQLYLRSRPDEVIAKVLEHHRARAERPPAPRVPPGAPGYPADVLEALLGGGRRG